MFRVFMRDVNSLASFEGYISVEYFSMVVPLTMIALAIVLFGGVIGKEERIFPFSTITGVERR